MGVSGTGSVFVEEAHRVSGQEVVEPGDGPEWGGVGANVSAVGTTYAVIEVDEVPDDAADFSVFELEDDGGWGEVVPHERDGLEFTLPNLIPGQSYDVTVQARDESGYSDDGPNVSFTTDIGDDWDGIDATVTEVGITQAVLELDGVPENVDQFAVLELEDDGGWGELVPHERDGLEFTLGNFEPETEYDVTVQALIDDGDEPYVTGDGPELSFETTSFDAFGWPDGASFEVVDTSDRTATLTWDAAEPAGEVSHYYLIPTETGEGTPVGTPTLYRGEDGSFAAYDGALTVEDGVFTYQTGELLDPETEYEFELIAQLGPEQSSPLVTTGSTADPQPSEWDERASAAVTDTTESTATLEVDGYPIPFEYFEELVVYDEDGSALETTAVGDLVHEIDGLQANTTYEITVEARDEFGLESNDGPTVEFTTSAVAGPTYPAADPFQTTVTVSWYGPATGEYRVYRNGAVVGTVDAETGTTPASTFAYEDAALEAETPYEYEIVREVDGEVSEPASTTAVTGLVGATAIASVNEDGVPMRNPDEVDLSGDGRYVVYASGQLYRHDVQTGTYDVISGVEPDDDALPFGSPFEHPAINGDGSVVAFTSSGQVYVHDVDAGTTALVSGFEDESGDVTAGDGTSVHPSVSGDGRYVAFESDATDLVDEDVTETNVYVYDREEENMHLVPAETGEMGFGVDGLEPAISPDGRYVAFHSDNPDLVTLPDGHPGDQIEVYLYDLETEEVEWVSGPNDGTAPDGRSTDPAVSEGGEFVAFTSRATNLIEGASVDATGKYRYDRGNETIELVGVDNDGEPISSTRAPAITPDGRYVAFGSYRVDTEKGVASDFGYNNSGDPWEFSYTGSPTPDDLSISDDGTRVAFYVYPFGVNVPNLAPLEDGSNNAYVTTLGNESVLDPPAWDGHDGVETSDVLAGELTLTWDDLDAAKFYYVYVDDELYATTSSETTEIRLTRLEQGEEHELRVEAMNELGILSEGGPRTNQTMPELTAPSSVGTTPYDAGMILHWSDDLVGGELDDVEVYREGTYQGRGDLDTNRFFDDGLEPETTYEYELVFWDEHWNEVTISLEATTLAAGDGIETVHLDRVDGEPIDGNVRGVDVTADGETVVFGSRGELFDLPDEANRWQVYLRTGDGDLELVSRPDGTGTDVAADGISRNPRVNDDGSVVVFRSRAENLDEAAVPGNRADYQLYLRDRIMDTTHLLTRGVGGEMADSSIGTDFDVSRDGERVVFTTSADNVHHDVDGDDGRQVYLYDRATGLTTLVSRGLDSEPADGHVRYPSISRDGEYVTFSTAATNLVEDVTNEQSDVYRYAVETGEIERVSVTAAGEEIPAPDIGSDNARDPVISEDGGRIAFISTSEALGADGTYQLFVWSEETGVTEHVAIETHTWAGYTVEWGGLSISPDGRFVAFESASSIAVPRDGAADSHLYVHDLVTEYTMRADVNSSGEPASDEHLDSLDHLGAFRFADTTTPTLLYVSRSQNLADGISEDHRFGKAFRTELTRFDAVADVDPPSWQPGTDLETTPVGQGTIELRWDPAVHELGVDSYVVTGDGLVDPLIVSGTETSVLVDGLEPDTTYTFEVHAVDATGQESSPLSAEETTLDETALVTLQTAVEGNLVDLEWEAATEASGLEGYLVQHREPGSEWVDRATIEDRETTTASDTGLFGNTTYEYRVLGVDADGSQIDHTTTATITTPALRIDTFVWAAADRTQLGHVELGGELALTVVGEHGRTVTVDVDHTTWYDEDGTLRSAPRNATERVVLNESDPGVYHSDSFTVPEGTAAVTALRANLTDGESMATTSETDLDVAVAGSLVVSVSSTNASSVDDIPTNTRIEVWSDGIGHGETEAFDGERHYTFDELVGVDADALDDPDQNYEVRVRAGSRSWASTDNVSVRAGLENPIDGEPVELVYEGPTEISVNVVTHSGDPVGDVRVRAYDGSRWLGSATADESSPVHLFSSDASIRHANVQELRLVADSLAPGQASGERSVDVEPGEHTYTIQLPEAQSATISGVVADDDEPVGNATVVATGYDGQSYTVADTTDEDGAYELDVFSPNVTVSATRLDSTVVRTTTDEHALEGLDLASNETATLDLEAWEERRYEFSVGTISYQTATGQLQTISSIGGAEADHLQFTVEGENVSTLRASRSWGGYPVEAWLPSGETVELSISPWQMGLGELTHTVELGEETHISPDFEYPVDETVTVASGQLRLPGDIAWEPDSWRDRGRLTVYDEDGSRVVRQTVSGPTVAVNLPEPGTYDLRVTVSHDGVDHFASETFTLENGSTTVDLGAIEVQPGGRFGFQDGNTITADPSEVTEGSYSTVRATYDNTGSGNVTDARLNVTLPAHLTLVEGSTLLDGESVNVSVAGDVVTVALGDVGEGEHGDVRFQVETGEIVDPRDDELTATVAFDDEGERHEEWLGTVELDVGSITIDVPETVQDRELTLRGRAPGESSLRVSADGQAVGETTVAPNGRWSMDVSLPETEAPHWYRLTADVSDGDERASSPGYLVLYDPEEPHLQQVTMWQGDDEEDVENLPPIATANIDRFLPATADPITFSTEGGVAEFPRTMLAGLPFMFELEFSDPDRVSDVEVYIDGPAGGYAEAEQVGDIWVARMETDRSATWRAGKIYVGYETDTPTPPEHVRHVSVGDDARQLIAEPIDPQDEDWELDDHVLIGDSAPVDGDGESAETADVETAETTDDESVETAEIAGVGTVETTDGSGAASENYLEGLMTTGNDSGAPGPSWSLSDDVHLGGDIEGHIEMELSTGHQPLYDPGASSYTGFIGTSSSSGSTSSPSSGTDSIYSHAYVNVHQPSSDKLVVTVSGEIPLSEFEDADPAPDVAPEWNTEASLEVANVSADGTSATLAWTPAQDSLWVEEYRLYRIDGEEKTRIGEVFGDSFEANVTGLAPGQEYEFAVEAVNPHGVESDGGPTQTVTAGDVEAEMNAIQSAEFERLSNDLAEPEWQTALRTTSESGGNWVRSTNRVLLRAGGPLDIISAGKDVWDAGEDVGDLSDLEDNWPDCAGPMPQDLQNAIDDATMMSVAGVGTSVAFATAGVLAPSGIGLPAAAALTAVGTATTLAVDHQKQQAYDSVDDELAKAREDAMEDCEEDELPPDPDPDDDDRDNRDDGPPRGSSPIADPGWKIDPSGFVYEVVEDEPIQGVTATVLKWEEDEERWIEWDADWWGETNPQTTDAGGNYGWDVPPGDWRVVYEKEGYETTFSEDYYGEIEVPPPHFDVNVPMMSHEPSELESVDASADGSAITLAFTRHLDTERVNENTVFVRTTGEESETVDATVVFPETVANPHTDDEEETLTQTVRIEPDEPLDAGEYEVVVSELIESYAGVALEERYEEPLEVSGEVSFTVTIDEVDSPVTVGETLAVTATLENEGDASATGTVELRNFDGDVVADADVEVEGGANETVTLGWKTGDGDIGTGEITVQSGDDVAVATVTIEEDADEETNGGGGGPPQTPPSIPDEPASFAVIALDVPAEIDEDAPLAGSVTVENVGDETGGETVEILLDGDRVEDHEVTLGGGKSTSVDFEIPATDLVPGDVTVSVAVGGDSVAETVQIAPADAADPATFAVVALDVPAEVDSSEPLAGSVTIENVGDEPGTKAVEIRLDGDRVEDHTVTLDGGESTTIDVAVPAAELDPGEVTLTVAVDGVTDTATTLVGGDSDADEGEETEQEIGDDGSDDDSIPGFGILVALLSLATIGVLATRRRLR
ncbi:hypothetical protein GCM10025298_10240 [Natronobiforma cellulositropha]